MAPTTIMAGKPILELGDLVPQHRPMRIGRQKEEFVGPEDTKHYSTEIVTLQAYVYGPRCPVVIKAALAQVAKKAREQVEAGGGIMSDEIFQEYARDSIMALTPGLTFEEADILASDADKCTQVLQYLDYWKEDAESSLKVAEDDEGEVKREESLITQESSLTLVQSTLDSN